MTDPLKDKDQTIPTGTLDPNALSSPPGTIRERATAVSFSSDLKLEPQVEAADVKVNDVPELDRPAESAFETPPIVQTERKESITSSSSITVQTSNSTETTTSAPAKSYIVSRSEVAGKNPANDSIVGLFRVEKREELKEARAQ